MLIRKYYVRGPISLLIKECCAGDTTSLLIKNVVPKAQQAFLLKTLCQRHNKPSY